MALAISYQIDNSAGRYLKQALKAGNLSHAYLIYGPVGVGKARTIEQFLQTMYCQSPINKPCQICRECRQVLNHTYQDVYWLTKDSDHQEITIQQIRALADFVKNRSYTGQWRTVVITPAEQMNAPAANALLKILEEPAPPVIFFLLAVNWRSLPLTIISRCQLLPIGLAGEERIIEQLQQAGLAPDQAAVIARLAQGRVGTAFKWARDDTEMKARQELASQLVALLKTKLWSQGQLFFNKYLANKAETTAQVQSAMAVLRVGQEVGRDIIKIKLGLSKKITYQNCENELKFLADKLSYHQLKFLISEISAAQSRLQANGNVRLTWEILLANYISYEQA